MTAEQLRLRAAIFAAFAETGAPPELRDSADLRALEDAHVVVLDDARRIVMAHPFAAPGPATTTVRAPSTAAASPAAPAPRTWHGSCAWDGLGIVAALGLEDATIVDGGGVATEEAALFHVAVPARHWWDDIAFT